MRTAKEERLRTKVRPCLTAKLEVYERYRRPERKKTGRTPDQQESQEEQQKEQAQRLAKQYLTVDAQSRLENVRAARPQQASKIEQQIVQLGMSGQVNGKISDSELKRMLKGLNQKGSDYKMKYR